MNPFNTFGEQPNFKYGSEIHAYLLLSASRPQLFNEADFERMCSDFAARLPLAFRKDMYRLSRHDASEYKMPDEDFTVELGLLALAARTGNVRALRILLGSGLHCQEAREDYERMLFLPRACGVTGVPAEYRCAILPDLCEAFVAGHAACVRLLLRRAKADPATLFVEVLQYGHWTRSVYEAFVRCENDYIDCCRALVEMDVGVREPVVGRFLIEFVCHIPELLAMVLDAGSPFAVDHRGGMELAVQHLMPTMSIDSMRLLVDRLGPVETGNERLCKFVFCALERMVDSCKLPCSSGEEEARFQIASYLTKIALTCDLSLLIDLAKEGVHLCLPVLRAFLDSKVPVVLPEIGEEYFMPNKLVITKQHWRIWVTGNLLPVSGVADAILTCVKLLSRDRASASLENLISMCVEDNIDVELDLNVDALEKWTVVPFSLFDFCFGAMKGAQLMEYFADSLPEHHQWYQGPALFLLWHYGKYGELPAKIQRMRAQERSDLMLGRCRALVCQHCFEAATSLLSASVPSFRECLPSKTTLSKVLRDFESWQFLPPVEVTFLFQSTLSYMFNRCDMLALYEKHVTDPWDLIEIVRTLLRLYAPNYMGKLGPLLCSLSGRDRCMMPLPIDGYRLKTTLFYTGDIADRFLLIAKAMRAPKYEFGSPGAPFCVQRFYSLCLALACVRRVMLMTRLTASFDDHLVGRIALLLWDFNHPITRFMDKKVYRMPYLDEYRHLHEGKGEFDWMVKWEDCATLTRWCREHSAAADSASGRTRKAKKRKKVSKVSFLEKADFRAVCIKLGLLSEESE